MLRLEKYKTCFGGSLNWRQRMLLRVWSSKESAVRISKLQVSKGSCHQLSLAEQKRTAENSFTFAKHQLKELGRRWPLELLAQASRKVAMQQQAPTPVLHSSMLATSH